MFDGVLSRIRNQSSASLTLRVALLLWLMAVLSTQAYSADLLVLIRPNQALPTMNLAEGNGSEVFIQSEWILWPHKLNPEINNPLLSIMSGRSWRGSPTDDFFIPMENSTWRAQGFDNLQRSGYVISRQQFLGSISPKLLISPRGTTTTDALFLALGDSNIVRGLTWQSLRNEHLLVYAASGIQDWTDIRQVSDLSGGRTIVVEYPPSKGDWGRYWLFRGFDKTKTPVSASLELPGLVPSSQIVTLLTHPDHFKWVESAPGQWGGPNLWLTTVRDYARWILAAWAGIAALGISWAVLLVMTEHRGAIVQWILSSLPLFITSVACSGQISKWLGIGGWIAWVLIAFGIILVLTQGCSMILNRASPKAHLLLSHAVVCFVLLSLCDPNWTLLSSKLMADPSPTSAEMLGVWCASLLFLLCYLPATTRRWLWLLTLAVAVQLRPWWASNWNMLALFAAFELIAERYFRWQLLVVLFLLPTNWLDAFRFGFCLDPLDQMTTLHTPQALNWAHHLSFLASPALWLTLSIVGYTLLFGSRYFMYQAAQLFHADARRHSMFWGAGAAFALSPTMPYLLHVSLILGLAGLIILLIDAMEKA